MRRYLIFAVVALPVLLGNMQATAVAVAFPTMVAHFDTSLVLAGWVLSIYVLVSISAIPITAKLSDAVGRRSAFMLCLGSFVIGSILCALAPNIGWLILFRVIQGAGGGGFISAASGIISDELPDVRQQSIGLLSSVANIGSLVGPNIGGLMAESLGWQSLFWLNVPIGVIALVLCKYLMKADVKKAVRSEVDLPGIALLSGFVSAIMISLTLMGKAYHVPLVVAVMIGLLGILFLVMFVYWSKNAPGAAFNMQLLTQRQFLAANCYNFLYGICTQSGIVSLLPLYATSVYGMSVLESGLMITPRSIGVIAASIIASLFLLKSGYRRPIIGGTLAISLGFALLALEPGGTTLAGISLTPIVLGMIFALIIGIGAGTSSPASNNACIELMPDKVASITGLRQVARRMGGAIGIAVSTLVLESSSSLAWGFTLIFLGSSAMMLLSIPAVFFMPESPFVKRE